MSAPTYSHTQDFLDKLRGVTPTGNGWEARCPCRDDDDNPSLAISEDNRNGNILVTCHRGIPCSTKEICESMGISVSALFPPEKRQTKEKLTFVKAYDYTDEDGTLLFQKVRYVNEQGKKKFLQRKPTGQKNPEWDYSIGDTPKVLYNLPAVTKAVKDGQPVWVVEGEKDADTLIEKGIIATTSPNGAGKWLPMHTKVLAGAVVEIIADNDEPGRDHARMVAEELAKAGCDVQVWVSPTSKDITDHISNGHTIGDLEPLELELPDPVVLSPAEQTLQELTELLSSGGTPEQLLVKTNRLLNSQSSDRPVDFGRLVEWEEFVDESDNDEYDWLIPGLLEKGERVIVVAAEGVGKTMLARQVAICSAAGISPFTLQKMKPIRTLTVDLENPEKIIRRTGRQIVNESRKANFTSRIDAQLVIKPSGLNLLTVADRQILERHIEAVEPELLVMGPLYKSFVDPGGRTSEAIAVEVAKYLDEIRTIYGCAMWLEHHAPLGTSMTTRDLRPFGSAVWSRWPEFGISLTPDVTATEPYTYDVKHFRGARDERQWPTKIKRGKRFPFQAVDFGKV